MNDDKTEPQPNQNYISLKEFLWLMAGARMVPIPRVSSLFPFFATTSLGRRVWKRIVERLQLGFIRGTRPVVLLLLFLFMLDYCTPDQAVCFLYFRCHNDDACLGLLYLFVLLGSETGRIKSWFLYPALALLERLVRAERSPSIRCKDEEGQGWLLLPSVVVAKRYVTPFFGMAKAPRVRQDLPMLVTGKSNNMTCGGR